MRLSPIPKIYATLYRAFGPQHWWPGETPFEVMVGAILTQNTNWQNVSRAIAALKKENLLTCKKLHAAPLQKLAQLIRPAGYYNIKAKRLKNFIDYFYGRYKGSVEKMRKHDTLQLRHELLAVNGIGEETADSILLYALQKPVFVVDAYTRRVCARHALAEERDTYAHVQKLFMKNVKTDVRLFNEYHALIVKLGKDFCKKTKPLCDTCPLRGM